MSYGCQAGIADASTIIPAGAQALVDRLKFNGQASARSHVYNCIVRLVESLNCKLERHRPRPEGLAWMAMISAKNVVYRQPRLIPDRDVIPPAYEAVGQKPMEFLFKIVLELIAHCFRENIVSSTDCCAGEVVRKSRAVAAKSGPG
jgi:hypothetical protein